MIVELEGIDTDMCDPDAIVAEVRVVTTATQEGVIETVMTTERHRHMTYTRKAHDVHFSSRIILPN